MLDNLVEVQKGRIGERWGVGPAVSVVIPALNEAENLPHVLPKIPSWVHEVLLVDGNSTDQTVAKALELHPQIRIIRQTGRGKADALRCGFQAVTGDIVVMLDADGSTDPGEIPEFVDVLLRGADFAKGSRFSQGGGSADITLYRRLGNWSFVMLVRVLFGGTYSDLCYGYNAFWIDILPVIDLECNGFEIETKMHIQLIRSGVKVIEVPSFEGKRINGNGHLRALPDGWRILKTIFREAYDYRMTLMKRKLHGLRRIERIGSDMRVHRSQMD